MHIVVGFGDRQNPAPPSDIPSAFTFYIHGSPSSKAATFRLFAPTGIALTPKETFALAGATAAGACLPAAH